MATLILAVSILAGCAATPQTDQLLTNVDAVEVKSKELSEVPFFPQQEYQCGPAALATVLGASGLEVKPAELVPMVYVPERKGSFQLEMLAAARRHQRIPYTLNPEMSELVKEVAAGNPVLVLQNLGLKWYPQWHFAVVVGFDLEEGEFILRSGELKRLKTRFKVFENTWRRSNYWSVVMLKPGQIPATAEEKNYFLSVSSYAERGEPENINEALIAGLKKWPDSIPLKMGLANYYYTSGQPIQAEKVYRDVLDHDPDYAPAHNNLALVLLDQGKKKAAIDHAHRAVALGGQFVDHYQATLKKIEAKL